MLLLLVGTGVAFCLLVVTVFLAAVALQSRASDRQAKARQGAVGSSVVTPGIAQPPRRGFFRQPVGLHDGRTLAVALLLVLCLAAVVVWRVDVARHPRPPRSLQSLTRRDRDWVGSWRVARGALDVGPGGGVAFSSTTREGQSWPGGLVIRENPAREGADPAHYTVQLRGPHGACAYDGDETASGILLNRPRAPWGTVYLQLHRWSAQELVLSAKATTPGAKTVDVVLRPAECLPFLDTDSPADAAPYLGRWALHADLRLTADRLSPGSLLGSSLHPRTGTTSLGGLRVFTTWPNRCEAEFVSANGGVLGPFPAVAASDGLFVGLRSTGFFFDGIARMTRDGDGNMTLTVYPPTEPPSSACIVERVARIATQSPLSPADQRAVDRTKGRWLCDCALKIASPLGSYTETDVLRASLPDGLTDRAVLRVVPRSPLSSEYVRFPLRVGLDASPADGDYGALCADLRVSHGAVHWSYEGVRLPGDPRGTSFTFRVEPRGKGRLALVPRDGGKPFAVFSYIGPSRVTATGP